MSSKDAKADYPIHPLLIRRWSPRAFQKKSVEKEKLRRLFEAVRWSPSASNQQPWRFIIGLKGDATYRAIYDCLVEFNQIWTKTAPVLMISCGRKVMNEKEEINSYYVYDTGQSLAYLTFQAMHEGLYVHQMGGFDQEKAVRTFNIPAMYKPVTAIAIGYLGDHNILPERMQKSELAERKRIKADEFVYTGIFGKRSGLFSKPHPDSRSSNSRISNENS